MTTTEAIPVHLIFVLDRTGSMQPIRGDVIGGFNTLLADQKAKPGECVMTLIQFDSEDPFEVLADAVPLDQVPELTTETYVPRGSTPLLDAEGRAIVRMEERAAKRAAIGEPGEAVVYATYTDGLENASREWTFATLSAKKKEHEDDWAFLYLGVGHDAYNQARSVGTMSVNTVSAARTGAGTQEVYDYYVGEVDNARQRAAGGQSTGSHQTRSAEVGRAAREAQDRAAQDANQA
jgi:hypothetical protein